MQRFFITALTLLSFALPACGQLLPAQPQPQFTFQVTESAENRTIVHRFGQTSIPKTPQRVVLLGEEGMLTDLLDAGIKPIAASVNSPESLHGFNDAELQGVDVFNSTQPNLDRIAALNPDLIVGSGFFIDQIGYDTLNKIAPTISIDASDWRQEYRDLLTVFGRCGLSQERLAAFDTAVANARRALNANGRPVSIGALYSGPSPAAWVDGPTAPPELVRDLGFTLSPSPDQVKDLGIKSGRVFFSLERLDLFQGDDLILLQSNVIQGEASAIEQVQANPLWPKLRDVQRGRVHVIDRLGYAGLRGRSRLLTELVVLLSN